MVATLMKSLFLVLVFSHGSDVRRPRFDMHSCSVLRSRAFSSVILNTIDEFCLEEANVSLMVRCGVAA